MKGKARVPGLRVLTNGRGNRSRNPGGCAAMRCRGAGGSGMRCRRRPCCAGIIACAAYLFFFFAAAVPLAAQGLPASGEEELLTQAWVEEEKAAAGIPFRLYVSYLIPRGMYQSENRDFFAFTCTGPEGIEVSQISYPEGMLKDGKRIYRGETVLSALVMLPETTEPGPLRLTVETRYQLCDSGGQCFFPKREEHVLVIPVVNE